MGEEESKYVPGGYEDYRKYRIQLKAATLSKLDYIGNLCLERSHNLAIEKQAINSVSVDQDIIGYYDAAMRCFITILQALEGRE